MVNRSKQKIINERGLLGNVPKNRINIYDRQNMRNNWNISLKRQRRALKHCGVEMRVDLTPLDTAEPGETEKRVTVLFILLGEPVYFFPVSNQFHQSPRKKSRLLSWANKHCQRQI